MACDRIAGNHKLYYAPYGQTTAPTYIGQTGPEGFNQIRDFFMQEITSDEYGPSTVVDHIYQGQNVTLEFIVQELNKDVVQMMLHPFQCTYTAGVATAVRQEDMGAVGRLGCGVYGVLEAIPAPFSPAEAFTGGSAAGSAGVYPGTAATTPSSGRQYRGLVVGTLTEPMDSRLRSVPIRFQCYPFSDSSVIKHWKWIQGPNPSSSLSWS